MEWMPIRRGPNYSGVVKNTSITQVIEWGNLVSIVSVDTLLADRSPEPTLAFSLDAFAYAASAEYNISAYYDETSETRQTFDFIAQGTKAELTNPNYSMIGEENKNLVRQTQETCICGHISFGCILSVSLLIEYHRRSSQIPHQFSRFLMSLRIQKMQESLGKYSPLPL